ncbi:iron chaperone [Okibacterium fritillariae]|uniref:Uncharacterized conserved protein YdhG, YjbR/CyaY-like superfamily, DUF1801 family n=1 Tax=Okibacterium fritillariae TaxID=123320 RepID=A0A1T5IAH3_9MICO|nr:DUF1801 domain-containing protein [Okibacterium fritillariae]SKC36151.1 Uncharacterized conserved protein YdhG, YjbR/CyaY-like superfamily, DUF1801 family [Okibacterium fritillariae]
MTENFTPEERAAMKERAAEVRKQERKGAKADPEKDLLEKIAEMTDDDRAIAERLHALVAEHAPALTPKTWYGMPGYALDGKVLVFFQAAAKFKVRYATIGFNDNATLDEGTMWPTAFAVTKLGPDEEAFIGELLRKAVPAP